MKGRKKIQVTTPAQTEAFAKEVAETLLQKHPRFTCFLEGGLGAGKTLFIKAALKALQVKAEVTSPTFTFLQLYTTPEKTFGHFDFYRLKNPEDFFLKGFDEVIALPHHAFFVEWGSHLPSSIRESFPTPHFHITITPGIGAGMRTIEIQSHA